MIPFLLCEYALLKRLPVSQRIHVESIVCWYGFWPLGSTARLGTQTRKHAVLAPADTIIRLSPFFRTLASIPTRSKLNEAGSSPLLTRNKNG